MTRRSNARLQKIQVGGRRFPVRSMATATAAEIAQQVFQEADKNKNGFLTKSELRKYFKTHPEEKNRILGSEFKWNEFFTNMDENGDNQFDLNEFTNFVTNSSKLAEDERKRQVSRSIVCRPWSLSAYLALALGLRF